MTGLIIFLIIIAIIVIYLIAIYNGLVTSRNAYKNAFAQIDVQLTRRHDLIPNLVETAKGYLAHERETLEAVTQARTAAMSGLGDLERLIGRIVYGTAGMLDGVIDRIREVLPQGETPTIVATGSNAPVIVRYCRNKVLYDKYLLMEGLWDIYQKNH